MKRSTPLRRKTPLRRRTRLRSRTPLRSRTRPKRRTPLREINRERRRKLRAVQYGPHADYICSLSCAVCGRRPVVPAHAAKTRGAGGTARHLVPLCAEHEDEFHAVGRVTFQRRHGIGLEKLAASLWANSPAREA